MAWSGGSFSRSNGTYTGATVWKQDDDNGFNIESTRHDTHDQDLADGINACLKKDGGNAATGDLDLGSNRVTTMADGTARTDAAAVGQIQDGDNLWADAGGTADALTAIYAPAVTTLVDGMELRVRAAAANATTTPTFSPNGLTARTIVKTGGNALIAGDIVGDGHELSLRYDATNTRWELLNPGNNVSGPGSSTDNAIARFDGAGGKTIQNSGVTIDDSNNIAGVGTINGNDATTLLVDADIGTSVQAYDADTLKADTTDTLTVGYAATPYNAGTQSSGVFTPDEANNGFQYAVNGGAHTLAPPANDTTIIVQYTNNASAGAITVSGFTATSGDSFTTTNGDDFMCYLTRNNGFTHLHIQALQ